MKQALLLCDSGWGQSATDSNIGQGHLFRCRAFAAHLQALGWSVRLLELSISQRPLATAATETEPQHYRHSLSTAQLQNLCALSQLPRLALAFCQGAAQSIDLLVIDSYQLPLAFYQSCSRDFPNCRRLALDDFNRYPPTGVSGYPEDFFVLQATAISNTKQERYLSGLEYQVLRPEFRTGYFQNHTMGKPQENHPKNQAIQPYHLLIPGSAFTSQQLDLAIETFLQNDKKTNLAVLLSPQHNPSGQCQQSEESGTNRLTFLANLSAAELHILYVRAHAITCAASQSFLEALAVCRPFIGTAMLTAENQLPLLEQYAIPYIDLRKLLAQPLTENTWQTWAQTLKTNKSLHNLAELSLPYIGDGLAVHRILQRIGLQ